MSAYVGMSPDLFNDRVIEMAGVAKEFLADLVRVLQATEDIINQRELTTLSQVHTLNLLGRVDVLDPSVVIRGRCFVYMLLELDDIRVWNDLGV